MAFSRGGQVSIEFLMIVAFGLLMSVPLIYVFFKQSQSFEVDVTAAQVDKAASEIRDAVDEVYYIGAPSKKTLVLYFPKNINNIEILPNGISFNVSGMGSAYEVHKSTAANISATSSLNTHEGLHNIVVEARTSDVLVTDS